MARGERFPQRIYARGDEPDARFTLANERTFLAWIGSALAMLSVGVGLESLALGLRPAFREGASNTLVLGGIACAVQAWVGWARVEIALRERKPLPSPTMVLLLPIIVSAAGLLVVLGIVTRWAGIDE